MALYAGRVVLTVNLMVSMIPPQAQRLGVFLHHNEKGARDAFVPANINSARPNTNIATLIAVLAPPAQMRVAGFMFTPRA